MCRLATFESCCRDHAADQEREPPSEWSGPRGRPGQRHFLVGRQPPGANLREQPARPGRDLQGEHLRTLHAGRVSFSSWSSRTRRFNAAESREARNVQFICTLSQVALSDICSRQVLDDVEAGGAYDLSHLV